MMRRAMGPCGCDDPAAPASTTRRRARRSGEAQQTGSVARIEGGTCARAMADQALRSVNQQKAGKALAILPHQGSTLFWFKIVLLVDEIIELAST